MREKLAILSMLSLLLFIFLLTGAASAQERFVLLQSKLLQGDRIINVFIDTGTIKLFVRSNFQDVWLKKTYTNGMANDEPRHEKIEKPSYKTDKAKNKIAYQLVHAQFDPKNSRYKILAVRSFTDKGQVLLELYQKAQQIQRSQKDYRKAVTEDEVLSKETDWTDISPDSIEEKACKVISDYIEKNSDQITYI